MKLTRSRGGKPKDVVMCLVGLRLIVFGKVGFKNLGLETLTGASLLSSVSLGNGQNGTLLGVVAKFRKATISFVLSVCPHRTTRLPLDGFS